MKQILVLISLPLLLASCSLFHKVAKTGKPKSDKTEKTEVAKVKKSNPKKDNKFAHILASKDNEFKYQMAEQYYANKKYNYAQQLFESLFPYLKGTQRYEDMYYKYAYCYFYDKDYINAENIFKTFTETFPTSARSEECDYMKAFCYYKQSPKYELDQTNTTKAIGSMQAFINTHPGSPRSKDANDIIDKCREKLELKESKNAELYYNLGFFRAAAVAYTGVSEGFPDSKRGDEYKLQIIKSYFKFAEMSNIFKQEERFTKVLSECTDFSERYADSKLAPEVAKYKTQSTNYLKTIKNEQAKTASQQ